MEADCHGNKPLLLPPSGGGIQTSLLLPPHASMYAEANQLSVEYQSQLLDTPGSQLHLPRTLDLNYKNSAPALVYVPAVYPAP